MASLKTLKNRIKSVKSTQKITKAMKMVAAAKLRRAREAAEAARPYAEAMENMVANLAAGSKANAEGRSLLSGTGKDDVQLLVIATSDRGLCGGFNSSIVRSARKKIRELVADGKQVKLYFIGRKGYEALQQEFGKLAIERKTDVGRKKLNYSDAETIASDLIQRFDAGEFDQLHIVYNKFKSAISQVVTWQQLVPLAQGAEVKTQESDKQLISYEYEPSEEEILSTLLPKNIGMQVYKSLLENAASEQGARMNAMDSATRNAGEMIKKLSLVYNRNRQAVITKELIEIISGAEAV